MAAPNNEGLIEAAMVLRGAAPVEWDRFVQAVGGYANNVTFAMVACDPTLLPRAQGMSIAAGEIAHICKNAPDLYEKLRAGKEKARNVASQQQR